MLCITNNSVKHQSLVCTHLNDQTVLFLTTQFSMLIKLNGSKHCYVSLTIQLNICHLFTLLNGQTVLFQTIQFGIRYLFTQNLNVKPIDRNLLGVTTLGTMAMKRYSIFPRAPAVLIPHHQIVSCHIQDTHWRVGSYPSTEMHSVYPTAPADWALVLMIIIICLHVVVWFQVFLSNTNNFQMDLLDS